MILIMISGLRLEYSTIVTSITTQFDHLLMDYEMALPPPIKESPIEINAVMKAPFAAKLMEWYAKFVHERATRPSNATTTST